MEPTKCAQISNLKTRLSSTSLTPSRPAPPAPQRAGPGATYNPAFSIPSSSGSSYSGIGGSPNRNSENIMNTHVVRSGTVSVKEDGFATSWLWRPKWLVLKELTLSIHKSEVSLIYRPLRTSPPYHHPLGHGSTTSPSGTTSLRDIACQTQWSSEGSSILGESNVLKSPTRLYRTN
jgi:hypothetical protein